MNNAKQALLNGILFNVIDKGFDRLKSEVSFARPCVVAATTQVRILVTALFFSPIPSKKRDFQEENSGLVRDLNPGPLAPKARIIPLDQRAAMSLRLKISLYPYLI